MSDNLLITHVAITVPDLDLAEAFYIEGIGFKEIYRKSWANNTRMDNILGVPNSSGRILFLSDGNMGLELFEFTTPEIETSPTPPPATRYGWMHIAFKVKDIFSVCLRLKGFGFVLNVEPTKGPTGNWATYGRDPFGNLIELIQPCKSNI
jgi:catechol 2,3-dioxygenase-like lactoylglutathione lyase family enzyme